MQVTWYGQSAFALVGSTTVFIDPFGDMRDASARGWTWSYPAIANASAELLLITHEHRDHNGAEAIIGVRQTIRSLAGSFDTPISRVIGIASEHDAAAGTQRGANVIYAFELDGMRVCHMGDFGQAELRPEQRAAIGQVDLLFVPVGGGATIDGHAAAKLVDQLRPALIVPMHYRTPAISFLDNADAFLGAVQAEVVTPDRSTFDTNVLQAEGGRIVVMLAPPLDAL